MRSALAVGFSLLAAAAIGCGEDDPAASDAGKAASSSCTGCAAGQGCLAVTVKRIAADAELPWRLFAGMADGVGMLTVSALPAGRAGVTKSIASADFRAASARYDLDLGCVAAGPSPVWAYLDDNQNARPGEFSSSDFRDTCPSDRPIVATITAGATNSLDVVLAQTCD